MGLAAPLLLCLTCPVAFGLCAVAAGRSRAWATGLGVAGTIVGATAGLTATVSVLARGRAVTWDAPWSVPSGHLALVLDPLAALFLAPTLLLAATAAVYGSGYLAGADDRRSLGPVWFFFNTLVTSMVWVVLAANAVLFLVAWEVMSLSSYFLVTHDHHQEEVQAAGRTYLIATHLGTLFLFIMFFLMGRAAGSMDFPAFPGVATAEPRLMGWIFLCAVVGFGTKAGFLPLHVWLPEAHPAAPSHVSALMSGVMIKTGIYGILRILTYLGAPAPWWGWLLVAVGLISGVIGVVLALAQQDLKRLLAYSSIENVGIIALAIGLGVLGVAYRVPALAALGFAGALLHVINHALFKGLLFLGAGAIVHATGTRLLDDLGGLLKRMPRTGALFAVGVVAISALPPLNGFLGELVIYLAIFKGMLALPFPADLPFLFAVPGLALIGGLALACFANGFGTVFLGTPRSERSDHGHDPDLRMVGPMALLAICCLAVGLLGWAVVPRLFTPAVALLTPWPPGEIQAPLALMAAQLRVVSLAGAALLGLIGLLAWFRRTLLGGREVTQHVTWGCGYAAPTPRMQYTSVSFAAPLVKVFHRVVRPHVSAIPPDGLFPDHAAFATQATDLFRQALWVPVLTMIVRATQPLRWIQHGSVRSYVLYIVATLVVLLTWGLEP